MFLNAEGRSGFLSRILLLLTLGFALNALAPYLGRNFDGVVFAVTFGMFIAGTMSVSFFVNRLQLNGLLDRLKAIFVYAVSGAITAVCGLVGVLSGRDFSGMGRTITVLLFALIIVGFVNIVVQFGNVGNALFSTAGMVVLAGFLLFDAFRLSQSSITGYDAGMSMMAYYLAFNLFQLFFLRLLSESSSSSSSSSEQ